MQADKNSREETMQAVQLKTFFEPQDIVLVGARSSAGFGYDIPLILEERGWGDRSQSAFKALGLQ